MDEMTDLEDRVGELEERVEALESALRTEFGEAWNAYVRREDD